MAVRIAVIGGSGLYSMEGTHILEEREIPTPWGLPSDRVTIVAIAGEQVAFLPRHGKGHRYMPSEVPSRANVWALKSLGVQQIVGVSAVGSLSQGLAPGEFVLCDDVIDKTVRRPSTFFGDGVVGHVGFAPPFCAGLREAIAGVMKGQSRPFHPAGTYVCMEGPAFSSRAESELHRSWGSQVIGMTVVPEAKLAREAEICYATVAMVTDFDSWRPAEESVSVEQVVAMMKANTGALQLMIPAIVAAAGARGDCACRHAAANAIMTDPTLIPYDTRRKVALFYSRYWEKGR
jgi:5'-methylthioadenosine phosphorylase